MIKLHDISFAEPRLKPINHLSTKLETSTNYTNNEKTNRYRKKSTADRWHGLRHASLCSAGFATFSILVETRLKVNKTRIKKKQIHATENSSPEKFQI